MGNQRRTGEKHISDELREKVARSLAIGMGEIGDDVWKFYLREADAAIALCMEEAAKELDRWGDIYGDNAAAAIRALGEN